MLQEWGKKFGRVVGWLVGAPQTFIGNDILLLLVFLGTGKCHERFEFMQCHERFESLE